MKFHIFTHISHNNNNKYNLGRKGEDLEIVKYVNRCFGTNIGNSHFSNHFWYKKMEIPILLAISKTLIFKDPSLGISIF